MTFYTFGYRGKSAHMLASWLQANNALLLDIRFKPTTPVPGWHGGSLRRNLGRRYLHCKQLGNKNFGTRGDPIELLDAEQGIGVAEGVAAAGYDAVVLLCACADYDICHRKVVGDLLRARGHAVTELDLGALGGV